MGDLDLSELLFKGSKMIDCRINVINIDQWDLNFTVCMLLDLIYRVYDLYYLFCYYMNL